MRTFSQFEKKIIQELVKTDVTTNESNILIFIKNTVLVNKGIYVELKSKTVHIIGKPENKDQDVTEIFETIALFRYLESNDLTATDIVEINPNIEDCFMELMVKK